MKFKHSKVADRQKTNTLPVPKLLKDQLKNGLADPFSIRPFSFSLFKNLRITKKFISDRKHKHVSVLNVFGKYLIENQVKIKLLSFIVNQPKN